MASVRKTKKDFNKDQMYKKIMPSLQSPAGAPRSGSGDDIPVDPEELLRQIDNAQADSSDVSVLAQHRITNLMENIILDKMPRTMKVLRACGCERCHADIMAIALNQLPSMYVVIADEQARELKLKNLRKEYEVKVTAALIKAIQTVKLSPRHE